MSNETICRLSERGYSIISGNGENLLLGLANTVCSRFLISKALTFLPVFSAKTRQQNAPEILGSLALLAELARFFQKLAPPPIPNSLSPICVCVRPPWDILTN